MNASTRAGEEAEPLRVFIGEFQVAAFPCRLAIHGLGSCVAVMLHDPGARLAALGHILLPRPPSSGPGDHPGRFATTAIPAMLEALRERGAAPPRVLAKVAGGAQMFQFERQGDEGGVGARNVEAVLAVLRDLQVPLAAADTGGAYGRTVVADAGTGRLEVRAVRVEERIL